MSLSGPIYVVSFLKSGSIDSCSMGTGTCMPATLYIRGVEYEIDQVLWSKGGSHQVRICLEGRVLTCDDSFVGRVGLEVREE